MKKLSEVSSRGAVNYLTDEEKESIVYDGIEQYDGTSDVAIVLGGPKEEINNRALAAYQLFLKGSVSRFITTGFASFDDTDLTEAEVLRNKMCELGIPKENILLEKQATTTVENFIYSSVLLREEFEDCKIHSITVVTSPAHIKRASYFAKNYLPANVDVHTYYYISDNDGPGTWQKDNHYKERVPSEARMLYTQIKIGFIPEIEYR